MLRFRTAEMQHAISHAHFLSLGGSVVWSIVATVPLSLLIVATSGTSASGKEEIRPDGRRIVGGEKTDIKRHPWQVASYRRNCLGRKCVVGVSVESAAYAYRIDHLRRCKAQTRFLSLEPLLGPLDELDLRGIHWAIAGGESGRGLARCTKTGALDKRPVHQRQRAFPLQAMGWNEQKAGGQDPRRQDMG
jgi:Protein of unknown function (DUF5131)